MKKKTLQINDKVIYRGSWGTDEAKESMIESIDLMPEMHSKLGGKPVEFMTEDNYKRCVVNLADGHWCYGYQIDWEESLQLNS